MKARWRSAFMALALCLPAGAAVAQDCRPVLVARALFCPAGTRWEGVPLRGELDSSGQRISVHFGQFDRRVWLLFSRIPEDQLDDLPWWPGPEDLAEILAGFAANPYAPLGEEIERFYPLGEEVMAASMALRSTGKPYVNIYTYYKLEEDGLVVQTGIEGAAELSGEHKALHLEAVRAIREPSQ